VADGRLPALTPFWESVTVPGVFFAGNVTQAAPGLRKHGVASLSSMVCGFRYNARVLARYIAERVCGLEQSRPVVERERAAGYLIAELDGAPELAMQKGYLARVLAADGADFRDEGIVPLEAFVDSDADGFAASLEFDGEEAIRPVLYARRGGELQELVLPPHPLRRYDAPAYREPVADLVARTAA
jgi:hypothetical protein